MVAKRGDDLLALVLAHQAVVDEDARELGADGAVDQQRRDRRVHSATQAADNPTAADLLADLGDLLFDDGRGRPGHVAAAYLAQERLQDLLSVRRMDDLGMELDAVDPALDRLERRDRRGGRRREGREAGWGLEDRVPVRHPAGLLRGQAVEKPPVLGDGELRAPELADLGALDAAAQRQREQLHPVADAQHRDPQLEQLPLQARGALGVHRRRAAGQDQALGPPPRDLLDEDMVGQQLAEHPALADAPRDELGVLAAIVEDDDLVDRAGDVDRSALVGELGPRRRLGDDRIRRHATAPGCVLPRSRTRVRHARCVLARTAS